MQWKIKIEFCRHMIHFFDRVTYQPFLFHLLYCSNRHWQIRLTSSTIRWCLSPSMLMNSRNGLPTLCLRDTAGKYLVSICGSLKLTMCSCVWSEVFKTYWGGTCVHNVYPQTKYRCNRLEVNKCILLRVKWDKSNARALNFDTSNARGQQDWVHWTSIEYRASALICHISRAEVNATLLT